jgi:hypothetical protein
MSKKPWYIWLSIPAFMLLTWDTSKRIHAPPFHNPFTLMRDSERFLLQIKSSLNVIVLWACLVMLPMVSFILYDALLSNKYPQLSSMVGAVLFVSLYLLGVYATYKHVIWREKNISHLLNKSGDVQEENTHSDE